MQCYQFSIFAYFIVFESLDTEKSSVFVPICLALPFALLINILDVGLHHLCLQWSGCRSYSESSSYTVASLL